MKRSAVLHSLSTQNSDMSAYSINPKFFKGVKGDIFVLNVQPVGKPKGHAIYLPPIGEELNRCRTTMATHAKVLASEGIECSLVDYYGTGDSDGDFSQGELSTWLEDLSSLVRLHRDNSSTPLYFIGFRLGALIAMDFVNKNPELVTSSILIQPIAQGKQFVTQLLRQRMAGQISQGLAADSTEHMRLSLNEVEHIEIGGYEFNSKLLKSLDELSFNNFDNLANQSFYWMEFEQIAGKGVSIGSRRIIDNLTQSDNDVDVICVQDPPIWQLHERALAPNNVESMKMVAAKW